ncbi:MAG: hypothetical protein KAH01_05670 [Caldisericia bacterium]|nr:hypothetical protein [Caldisericia bacterium]
MVTEQVTDNDIVDPLAAKILTHDLLRSDNVLIDYKNNELIFTKKEICM